MPLMKRRNAFTLIELLIVIAIIALLALIAIPNFLEAQVRARVSRARADLRTIAAALEQYAVSWNTYPPNDGAYNVIPIELTTPVAYITDSLLVDPFAPDLKNQMTPNDVISRYYTYTRIVTWDEAVFWENIGKKVPYEAIDHWSQNKGAFEKYGKWRLVSKGPDRVYLDLSFPPPVRGSDVLYDPTNGTASFGNILRTQKSPSGATGR